jgi:hypothetical protein
MSRGRAHFHPELGASGVKKDGPGQIECCEEGGTMAGENIGKGSD